MKTRLFKNNIIQEIGWYRFSKPKGEKFHKIPKTYKKNQFLFPNSLEHKGKFNRPKYTAMIL